MAEEDAEICFKDGACAERRRGEALRHQLCEEVLLGRGEEARIFGAPQAYVV